MRRASCAHTGHLSAALVQAQAERARVEALEQARALGELDALRRQVPQLQALLGQRGQQ
ncbi:MAG TPA: hypothetical protein VFS21_33060 [Roseiflexaceae bacterium]|nr:hypothetical protein [Roseiflexaceae bacterium]